jgi:hypothetical protein
MFKFENKLSAVGSAITCKVVHRVRQIGTEVSKSITAQTQSVSRQMSGELHDHRNVKTGRRIGSVGFGQMYSNCDSAVIK